MKRPMFSQGNGHDDDGDVDDDDSDDYDDDNDDDNADDDDATMMLMRLMMVTIMYNTVCSNVCFIAGRTVQYVVICTKTTICEYCSRCETASFLMHNLN